MGKGRVKVDLDRKKEGLNKRTLLLSAFNLPALQTLKVNTPTAFQGDPARRNIDGRRYGTTF